MPASAIIVDSGNTLPERHALAIVDRGQISKVAPVSLAWALALSSVFGTYATAQTVPAPGSTATPAQPSLGAGNSTLGALPGDSEDSDEDRNSAIGSDTQMLPVSLSANQIENILEENPDLVMELKSQLADRMQQQQGVQIDPNDISDEALFKQIDTNANLRSSITSVLRARGYVSDDDLQSMASSSAGANALSPSLLSQQSFVGTDNGDTGLETNQSLGEARQRADEGQLPIPLSQSLPSGRTRQTARESPRSIEEAHASTDVPKVSRQPAPYNLQSMRDLYTQIPNDTSKIKRFGSDVFVNRNASAGARGVSGRDTPLDIPLGPDYILGPGDGLTIQLWGGMTQSIVRTIDRDGRIFLPESGSLQIAGFSLGRAESLIEEALKQQYRDAHVSVTVSRLRSVRVYVVGDVQRPGGYDISSLATPLSALYAAGGPTAVGSLRTLFHYREKKVIEEIDLYDFLLHGIHSGSARFESGDTLLIPPSGPQAAVFGAVKRPAVYELRSGETMLTTVIDDAGGFTAAASFSHIRIDRIDANRQRITVTLQTSGGPNSKDDPEAISKFQVKDGDRISVEPILPYSQRAIYLTGHVARPGRMPYSDGMRLSDVLGSYQDLLPEPSDHGEIVRLVPPDLHAETIDFSVPDVLIGNANVELRSFDTIRILGRYQSDAPMVTIWGEVLRPGQYPMSKGMTAAQLVRTAGGFKRDALLDIADLTSYDVKDGKQVLENLATVRIGDAVAGKDSTADVFLKPGDILSIHQITNWNDIGESVMIQGEVRFPGSYGFKDGERLSSVLQRAGGLLPTAYPAGAVLIREQVRQLEQKSRDQLIRQIETNSAAARLSPSLSGSNASGELQLIKVQQEQVLSELKSHPPTGRMVIHISADIASWLNTAADIELRRGDVLTIPKQPGFVLVTGQVYNATALTFRPGKNAGWYLSRAGGSNATANRKEIFVIRANGTVVGRHSEGGGVLSRTLGPGDVVVVPQKIIGSSVFWKNLLTVGQLASSLALTAGVAANAL